tara:strand:- start:903 stop:1418 length:516 start_codon:yes stop_codon:yes gene_type:complete
MLTKYKESLFICIFALLYALLEIEIEAQDGWAKNLPTPKILLHFTQYHVIMNLIVILVLAKVYYKEKSDLLKVIFIITLWFVLEDTYWFIYNSKYKITKYNKENVPWHKWFCGLPLGSWISIVIFMCIIFLTKDKMYSKLLIQCSIISVVLIILSPLYHSFYNKYHLENKK